MGPQRQTRDETRDQQEIRALIESWADAVRRRDLDRVVARHGADIRMFDAAPPVEARGVAAYRQSWEPFFSWFGDDGTFEVVGLEVTAGNRVAFATALLRCGSPEEIARFPEPMLRLTVGLRRIDGAWTITHEHHSIPDGS